MPFFYSIAEGEHPFITDAVGGSVKLELSDGFKGGKVADGLTEMDRISFDTLESEG